MTDGKVKKTKKREQKEEDDSPIASPKPKPVKQEEPKQEDDGDDHSLPLFKPKKSTLGDPKDKDPKTQKKEEAEKGESQPSKTMREEPHDSEQDDGKPNKEKMKKKMKIGKKSVEKKTVVKGKKVYDLPGQKHDTPDERDPLRIFYETLYRQLPDSELATVWMLEWGLLPPDEAKKVYEKKLKNRQQKLESPVKVVAVKKKSKVSVKKNEIAMKSISKTKKRKVKECTLDDDENSSISPKKTNKKHKSST